MTDNDERIVLLRALLGALERLDFDAVAQLLAENAVFDFPFRKGRQAISGRTAIIDDLRVGMGGFLRSMKFEVQSLHPCEDRGLLVAEYASQGVTVDGRPYANRYAALLRVRDGKIVLFREFFDPTAAAAARDAG